MSTNRSCRDLVGNEASRPQIPFASPDGQGSGLWLEGEGDEEPTRDIAVGVVLQQRDWSRSTPRTLGLFRMLP